VQCDTTAVQVLTTSARLTLVPLAVTLRAQLRARDLSRLRDAGPAGRLLARQAEAYSVDRGRQELARAHSGVADDLLNFHHDPLAAAVAVGWDGVRCSHELLRPVLREGLLEFERSKDGVPDRVAVEVDAEAFRDVWLSAVERAHH
jgi:inosine-uridine nucleoside N-ribohydrolase